MIKKLIAKFLRNDEGATAIEYGLIAALIGVAIIGSISATGTSLSDVFFDTGQNIKYKGKTGNRMAGAGNFNADMLDPNSTLAKSSSDRWAITNHLEGWDEVYNVEMFKSGVGATTPTGERWVELRGWGEAGYMKKALDIAEGEDYTLSFYANNRRGIGEMQIYMGGELVDTVSPTSRADWENFEYTVTGGMGDGSNVLEFREVSPNRNGSATGLTGIDVSPAG